MRILVVEDAHKSAAFIQKALKAEGFTVDVLHRGDEGLEALLHGEFAAAVLDIMLPGLDGLSLVRRLRESGRPTPVLLVSARGEIHQRVDGLDAGADDYLAKPYALPELIARVKALTRRGATEQAANRLKVADLTLDCVSRKVFRGPREIDLSRREFQILEYLMEAPGRIRTRMMMIEHVWGYDFDPGSNLVDVYIRKLREKVDEGDGPSLIHTVRGAGYLIREA